MPKQKPRKKGRAQRKNNDPLIRQPEPLAAKNEDSRHLGGGVMFRAEDEAPESEAQLVEPKSTWKIMTMAKKQQAEENPVENYDEEFPALSAFTGGHIF